jgi:hypothetical protein
MMNDPAALVAALDDLLQLDHDAVGAYTLAIGAVRDPAFRATLGTWRGDHERHIRDLSAAIRARGGVPVQLPHVGSGPFKLAVQGAAALGSDRAILLALRANERHARDKYRRAAESEWPEEVSAVVRAAADDEARHHDWVSATLEALGHDRGGVLGTAAELLEEAHVAAADLAEAAEAQVVRGAERARRTLGELSRTAARHPNPVVNLAAGVGQLASELLSKRK